MNCGDARQIRPARRWGSWVLYGLGTENQNLPGFIVMCPGGYPIQETQNWQSRDSCLVVLAGTYGGPKTRPTFRRLSKTSKNNYMTLPSDQREQLDLVQKLNHKFLAKRENDPALEARIESFELAYRMQTRGDVDVFLRHEQRRRRQLGICMVPATSPAPALSPAGWPNTASGSFNSITAPAIAMG